ncbi:MAG: c-type cytochrome [Pseudomonadota bacterium]
MRASSVLIVSLLLGLAGVPAHADEGLAAKGQALARQYCSGCHRVSEKQAIPPPVMVETETGSETVKAPSFWIAAHQEGRDEAYFRGYLHNPRYPMPEQPLEQGELDAIVAYLLSLGSQAGAGW